MDLKSSEATNETLNNRILELQSKSDIQKQNHEREIGVLNQKLNQAKEDIESSGWQLQTETQKRDEQIEDLRSSVVS